MSRTLRELWLFFWRDLLIATTYRTVFLLELAEALFGAAMLYYVARFVDSPQLERSLPQAGGYFAFSLVGFIFIDYLNVSLDTFDRSLQEARDSGTLEHLLVTQTSLPALVAGSAIYPFVATTIRIAIYIAWGVLLFRFPLHAANWLGVFAMLAATLLFVVWAFFPPVTCCSSSAATPRNGFCSASPASLAACFSPSAFCRTGCNSWRV